MDKQMHACRVEARRRRDLRRDDLLDSLELAEVIAATDAAERGVEAGSSEARFTEHGIGIAVPRRVEPGEAFGQLVEPQLAHGHIEPEQAHAATNVGAHKLWVEAVS